MSWGVATRNAVGLGLAGIVSLVSRAVQQAVAVVDPFFNYVTLLLPGNGTNGAQNNTFVDSSTNAFTITRNGNTTQGTFSPFSQTGWSNYFDGTGDYLSVADNAALEIGSDDFCIEAWIYLDALPATNTVQTILGKWFFGQYSYIFTVRDTSGTKQISFAYSTNGSSATVVSRSAGLTSSQWNHVAVTRSGSTVRLFLNGAQQGATQTVSATFYNGTTGVNIGRHGDNINYFKGYISNCRLVKGDAVYTANFTPPAVPLTAIANTSLLTCQSNRFIDNSTNNFAITRNGDVSVQAFSPFNPTAAWDASTNGGSGYFDGSGDYLRLADNAAFTLGSGDFTIECWLYPTAVGSTYRAFSGQSDSVGTAITRSFRTGITTAGKFEGVISKSTVPVNYIATSTSSAVANTWQHYAFVRDGNTTRQYINGVQDGTADVTGVTANNSSNQLGIGVQGEGTTSAFAGYMSDYRMVVGTCLYPNGTTFTPPTTPLTAISGTSLLCNFTNAGIYDATSKNDLETVGNAQISTTQSKFGGSSMYFDGTGDWLKAPNNLDLQFGTGDFTIELWVYLATGDAGSNRGLAAKGGASTGWLVSLDTNEKVVFTYTTSTITSSGAITLDAWNHIAVVREGTGSNETKIYINGTNDGTGTVNTDFNQTEVMYIGANRAAGDPMKGYIQDLRITKGVARYTTGFTPPTAAFPLT